MPSSMLEVNHGVPVAGMMSSWIAWPDCRRLAAAGIDRRVHPFVEMDEVAGIEPDTEERGAEVALDQRIHLAAGDADADGLVPLGGAGEIWARPASQHSRESPAGKPDRPRRQSRREP